MTDKPTEKSELGVKELYRLANDGLRIRVELVLPYTVYERLTEQHADADARETVQRRQVAQQIARQASVSVGLDLNDELDRVKEIAAKRKEKLLGDE